MKAYLDTEHLKQKKLCKEIFIMQETKKRLMQLIIEGNFPDAKEWNKIARKRRAIL